MTRLAPALCAAVILGVAGMRQAAAIRRQTALLFRWEKLLRYLSLLMGSGVMSLPGVLEQAANEGTEADRLLQAMAAALRSAPLSSLSELYARSPAPPPAHTVLERLFAQLGHGSRAVRIQAVDQAAAEMGLLAREAEPRAAKDARMWSQLGWAVGACAALLLI